MQHEYNSTLKVKKTKGSQFLTAMTPEQSFYQMCNNERNGVSPAASAAEKQPLSWNNFQHAHAGIGWTKADLSAAYAKAKVSAPTAETETLNWNAFQRSNCGRHWSRQRMSEEYQAARQYAVDLLQQSADMQKFSDWNAYLHRHKGQGWTQARLQLCTCMLQRVLQQQARNVQ